LQLNGDKKERKREIREITGRKKSKMNKREEEEEGMTDYLTEGSLGSCHK
jgi:hypothetical protein